MRLDPVGSRLAQRHRDPRVVVGIIFPTASIYVSNRSGITNVPGVHVSRALTDISSTSQEVFPTEGRSTIGTLSFSVVDLAGAVTGELRTQLLTNLRGVRGREVRVYTGDTNDFTDGTWARVETYVVDGLRRRGRKYEFSCSDRSREQRVEIFDRAKTRLTATLTAVATSISVDSTVGFELLTHTAAFSDAPSSTVGYLELGQTGEIVSYTGTSGGNTFTGVTRARFNTVAQAIEVDTGVAVDRRPEVEEFVYLEGPAAQLDYAIKTGAFYDSELLANGGGETGTVGAQATSWTLDTGNGALVAIDQQRVGARSIKIINATAADSRSYQDEASVVVGAIYEVAAWVRTSALPTADAGFGAVLNVEIVSGITGFTIVEKDTVGADPSSTQPDCGIAASGAAVDWTRVRCRFIPTGSNGTLRIHVQVGYGGTQSGTAWFDDVSLRRIYPLPSAWHMGIATEYVDRAQYDTIGADLFDPADVTNGLVLRFTHLDKTDGKRFCEEQLHVPMMTFSPIDSFGVIGIRRVVPVIAAASPLDVLNPNTVIAYQDLEHGLARVVNRVIVNWNFDGEDFTRRDVFINIGSRTMHGKAEPVEYELRGLTVTRHTREVLKRVVEAVFERRGSPPIEVAMTLSRSKNRLEVADPVRVTLPSIRDFTAAATLDRTFEMVSRRINHLTGDLVGRFFGSTSRWAPDEGSGTAAVLSDAWYSSEGVALSTVLTISANQVTANGNLAGNVDLRAGVYYHLGDLTINAGVTVTINNNVQLRIRGNLTVNGAIDGIGRGIAAAADPNSNGAAYRFPPGYRLPVGTLGSTAGSDGITYTTADGSYLMLDALQLAGLAALPRFALTVAAGVLDGVPADLRGTEGIFGTPVVEAAGTSYTVRALGGVGGISGAGLMIVSRGTVAFGASGAINLSGTAGTAGASVSLGGNTVYAGGGGGAAPGGLLIVLDGDQQVVPDLSVAFTADHGATTQTGNPIIARTAGGTNPPDVAPPWTGYFPGLGALDLWESSHVVQYAPADVQVGTSADEIVPPPTALAAVVDGVGVRLSWTSPAEELHDVVEVWQATTNDRTGAILLSSARASALYVTSDPVVTRYFWVRARRATLGHSAWHPTSPTGGVSATYGGAAAGAAQWTPILVNVTRSGNIYTKTGGVNATWDSSVYSQEGFEACAVSFRASQVGASMMIALNTDPATDHNFTSLDYALYCTAVGGGANDLQIYESGTLVGTFGTYATSDQLEIRYDGVRVRYLNNGVVLRSVPRIGARLFLDSSLYNTGVAVNSLSFTPISRADSWLSGNLLHTEAWAVGDVPAGGLGNFTLSESATDENAIVIAAGPHGYSQLLWEGRCTDPGFGSGGEANGGWNNGYVSSWTNADLQGLNSALTYRSTVWVRWTATAANGFYFGCGGDQTNNLAGSPDTNPYFINGPSLTGLAGAGVPPGKWYLAVGIIHGSGYGTAPSGIGGLYDPETGQRVYPGTDFKMIAGHTTQAHRTYMYYGGDTAVRMYWCEPRFEVVDGNEPPISALLTAGAGLEWRREGMHDEFFYADAAQLHRTWTKRQGGIADADITLLTGLTDAPGGQAVRFGNNSGNDEWWGAFTGWLTPYDSQALWEIGVVARTVSGTGTLYCGVEGVKADGVTLVNTAGADSYSSQHYVAALGASVPSTFTTYKGYFKGYGTTVVTPSNDPRVPSPMYNSTIVYVRPMLLVNYTGAAGQTDVAVVWLRKIPGGLSALNDLPIAAQDLATRGWTFDATFSATDADTVAWTSGTLRSADGTTTWSISSGNTGNMSARTFIYLDVGASTTVLQATTTAASAIGSGRVLIAVAVPNATGPRAFFQVYGGSGGILSTTNELAPEAATEVYRIEEFGTDVGDPVEDLLNIVIDVDSTVFVESRCNSSSGPGVPYMAGFVGSTEGPRVDTEDGSGNAISFQHISQSFIVTAGTYNIGVRFDSATSGNVSPNDRFTTITVVKR